MRKTSLSLRKTRVNGKLFWQVTIPKLGGGRERRTFRERADAQTFIDLAKVQQENHGTAAFAIPESLRVEAVDCQSRLLKHGKTLRDATEHYLAHLHSIATSRTVREVVKELLAAKKADGASERYLGDLRVRLERFNTSFGDEVIAAISARQISKWLRALGVGAVTRNTFRRRLAALFNFARRQGYLVQSPVVDVEQARERETEIAILTVGQTVKLLECASEETLPYWAIGAFAGLRAAEIERLEWRNVDFEGGFIELKAAKSKTASRRLIPMQPNLQEWLAPYATASGAVCPMGLRKKLEADRKGAGLLASWPQNGLRHSFGTYHLARFNDTARLALEMGNSPAMIFRHYREVVKPKAAESYWNIRPAGAANVVRLAAA